MLHNKTGRREREREEYTEEEKETTQAIQFNTIQSFICCTACGIYIEILLLFLVFLCTLHTIILPLHCPQYPTTTLLFI